MKSICVYCGSNPGRNSAYADAARALAAEMTSRGIGLVYGGSSVGIMGVLADAVLAHGGSAVGVIPESLMKKELAHRGLTELRVTASMHERKMTMAELADGFVALPGGIGTLEELFEIWTWAQLGLHAKPCGMLNAGGYYDSLIRFLDFAAAEEFVGPAHRSMLIEETTPAALLDRFAAYRAPQVQKWMRASET